METLDIYASLLFPNNVLVFIGLFWSFAEALAALGIVERLKGRNMYTVARILLNMARVGLVPSIATVIHVLAVYIQRFFHQLSATTQSETVIAGAVLFGGSVAFFFKVEHQFWYGLIELIAAMLFVVNAIAGIDPVHPNQLAVDSAVSCFKSCDSFLLSSAS